MAYYIGFEPGDSSMNSIMDRMTKDLRIAPVPAAQAKVEITCRPSANGNYYFVLNHSGEKVHFTSNPAWKIVVGTEILEPYGITIYHGTD